MLAVFQDLGLHKYIAKDIKAPGLANPTKPTMDELDVQKKWTDRDGKACTQIKLSIGNAEMIHISSATTVAEMWDQLCMVRESKGRLGVLATRCVLYREMGVLYTPPSFPMDFHRTQPIPTDPLDRVLDFQWNLLDWTKFHCLSSPSLVKVQ